MAEIFSVMLLSLVGTGSNRGREFVMGFPENRFLNEFPLIKLLVTSASQTEVTVRVTVPQGIDYPMQEETLLPGEAVEIELAHDLHMSGTSLEYKGGYIYIFILT